MNFLKVIVGCLFLSALICLLVFVSSNTNYFTSVKPGQVWKYKDDDPFKDKEVIYEVLSVKDGYIKYKRHDKWCEGCVGSMRLRTFKVDARLSVGLEN